MAPIPGCAAVSHEAPESQTLLVSIRFHNMCTDFKSPQVILMQLVQHCCSPEASLWARSNMGREGMCLQGHLDNIQHTSLVSAHLSLSSTLSHLSF